MSTFNLTIDNFIYDTQHCHDIEFTAPAGGATAGTLYLVGDIYVIALETKAEGETLTGYYRGAKVAVLKATGASTAIEQGKKLYINPATKVVSATATSGHVFCGISTHAAGDSDTRVRCHFDGMAVITVA